MKLIIIAVLICTLVISAKAGITKEEAMEAFKAIITECMKDTGATDADVGVLMKSLPAQNMETKCLRACIMKKINLMNADGKFDKSVALKLAEMHTQGDESKIKIAEELTGACESIAVPDDHCEAAELYKMCLVEGAKKHGVNIME